MVGIYTSALSGMNAAQIGLATTEHNIANANTPGFSRQQVVLGTSLANAFGGGYLGQGVDVTNVKRIYDQYLNTQVLQQQNQASYLSSYHSEISQIDNLLSDPTTGVSADMQNVFSAMNAVANSPESAAARQTFLSSTQSLVSQFQSLDQQLTDMANGLTGKIESSLQSVNSYAQQIAGLNGVIREAIASGQGKQPNDLLDQRDQLITQLNQEINATVLQQGDGTVSIFIGNGQPLVVDKQAMKLQAVQSASDPSKVDVVFNNGRNLIPLQQSSLQGGNLGAYINFREQSLEPARNALGRMALGMATSINQQNQLGQDQNGALGANLLNAAVPLVNQSPSNTGTAAISASITNVSALTTSDYQLKFDGSNYSLLRLSDNAFTNLGATLPQTIDGFTVGLTAGAAAAGDTFLIKPTAAAARDIALLTRDVTKVAAAAPMRATAATANLSSATISSGSVNTPPPPNANLQSTVSITFTSPTTFNVTGTGTGNPVGVTFPTASGSISYNGWTIQISGSPVAGDVFNVSSNINGAGDNRNALLMAGLQTQNLMSNGTTNLSGLYNQLVGEVGTSTHQMSVASQAQNNMLAKAVASQQSVSGVNLDEEAANLLQYQRAYQASAKAMQIANSMFDALLAIHP
jgi:flagellar hook-associated protein 1 FlgK